MWPSLLKEDQVRSNSKAHHSNPNPNTNTNPNPNTNPTFAFRGRAYAVPFRTQLIGRLEDIVVAAAASFGFFRSTLWREEGVIGLG